MNDNKSGTSAEHIGMNLKDLTVSPKVSKVHKIHLFLR